MRGMIESIERKSKGDKVWWLLTIDGQKYSYWNAEQMATLKSGQTIEFDFVQKNNFKNITGIIELPPSDKKNEYTDSKTWNTCLMCAKDLVVAMINTRQEAEVAYSTVEAKEQTREIALYLYHATEESESKSEDDIPF